MEKNILAGKQFLTLSGILQTGTGAHPASYIVDIRSSFPGGKAAGA
jgi:hypothetical protein